VWSSAIESPEAFVVIGFCCFVCSRRAPALHYLSLSEASEDSLIRFNAILAQVIILCQQMDYDESLRQFRRLLGLRHPTFTEPDSRFHIAVPAGLRGRTPTRF
jgi:hypothetical protein